MILLRSLVIGLAIAFVVLVWNPELLRPGLAPPSNGPDSYAAAVAASVSGWRGPNASTIIDSVCPPAFINAPPPDSERRTTISSLSSLA